MKYSVAAIILVGFAPQSHGFTQTQIGSQRSHLPSFHVAAARTLPPLTVTTLQQALKVWAEEAEENFVEHDENLEEGEECLLALKAFASNPENPAKHRFLSAGALVQRPPPCVINDGQIQSHGIQLYDAWIADSILDEGGPNLQKLGALEIVDSLFLKHLEHHEKDPIGALKSFIIQCSDSSDFTCGSFQAILDRGFQPMHQILVSGPTIYSSHDYEGEVNAAFGGNLFDYRIGKQRYEELSKNGAFDDSCLASKIVQLLPDEETIKRCTLTGKGASRDDKLMRFLLGGLSSESSLQDNPTRFD